MGKLPGLLKMINLFLISAFVGFGMFWLWIIMLPNINIFFSIFYGCLTSGATGVYLKLISQ